MKQLLAAGGSAISRRLAAHPYTIIGALLLLGFAVPFCLRKHSEWEEVYLRAAAHLRTGAPVYGPGESYLYPPFLAWLALPCTALPNLEARLAWYVLNVASLVLLLGWSWRLAGGGELEGSPQVPRREHVICLLGLACASYYALDCLTNQKCDLILGALMLGGCAALSRGRAFLAATLYGVAAGIRCSPLLWGAYLAWRGQWRSALWLGCVAIGINFLPNLSSVPPGGGTWVGEWFTSYLAPLRNPDRPPGEWGSEIKNNQSLSGAANRWFLAELTCDPDGGTGSRNRAGAMSPAVLNKVVLGGEFIMLLAVLLVLGRRPPAASPAKQSSVPRAALEYSLVLLLMLLVSPMSSKTHYCVLFLPAFCVARLAVERGDRLLWSLLVTAIAVGLLSNKDLWGNTIYIHALWYGSVTWSAVALLLGCGYALVRTPEQRQAPDLVPTLTA